MTSAIGVCGENNHFEQAYPYRARSPLGTAPSNRAGQGCGGDRRFRPPLSSIKTKNYTEDQGSLEKIILEAALPLPLPIAPAVTGLALACCFPALVAEYYELWAVGSSNFRHFVWRLAFGVWGCLRRKQATHVVPAFFCVLRY